MSARQDETPDQDGWTQDGTTPHPTGGYVTVSTENWRNDDGDTEYRDTAYRDTEGLLHREDGPALVRENLGTRQEWRYRHGRLDAVDGEPSYRRVQDGRTVETSWYRDRVLHREVGPAQVTVHDDGSTCREWWVDGRQVAQEISHTVDGWVIVDDRPCEVAPGTDRTTNRTA